ncbi:LANCL1 [Cordylochernes scorpioides]|uniref:LANCL1 n=1 Tax=Cordylochernes scorpioides TaxID=51811 RepID=A0ABY6LF05_9ARAC|nr:LANCL1 [Cordylochernes scorpioides]
MYISAIVPHDVQQPVGIGIALTYLHLAKTLGVQQYIAKALPYIERPMLNLKSKKFSFLGGDAGLICVAALVYKELGQQNEVAPLVSKLEKMSKILIPQESGCPDELLFGRVGFLYALLFVKQNIESNLVSDDLIREVVASVLTSGQVMAKRDRARCPLMYMWHDTYYIGAAHGLIGILYMLLQRCYKRGGCQIPVWVQARSYLTKEEIEELVKPTIDYIQGLQFPSGNFPSSLGKDTDRLVHWCHGAPGAIHLFCLAYEVFKEQSYLDTAYRCSDAIWQRGILRKGYGICHGVAGNAYGFVRLFQTTRDQRFLYRAVKCVCVCQFQEWCYEYGKHGCRIADRPLSLFEGECCALLLF